MVYFSSDIGSIAAPKKPLRRMLIAFSETVFRTLSQKGWANASTAAEFLTIAAEIPLRPQVRLYPLAEANRALLELQRGSARGVKVLRIQ